MAHLVPLATLFAGFTLLEAETHFTMPPVAWLALVLILHGARGCSPLAVAPLVWLAAVATIAIGERTTIPASGPAYAIAVAGIAATFALLFTIDRLSTTAFSAAGVRSTLIFPVVFVAIDFLRSRLAPNATWGAIAYTQYGVQPLMQLAAVAGIWGITFLMAWSAATIELAWRSGFAWAAIRGPVLTNAIVLAAAVLGGTVRVAAAATDRPAIRVATINRPADLFAPGEMTRITEGRVALADRARIDAKLAALHDWFLAGSRREARAGARLVAWPEQNLLVFADDEPAFLARARRVAAEEHMYLAMGLGTIHLGEPLPFENKLVLVDPAGRIVGS
jgi:apolipoprotein N-acyltransferase